MRHLLYIGALFALSGCLAGRSGDHVAPEPLPMNPAPYDPETPYVGASGLEPGPVFLAPEDVEPAPDTCTVGVESFETFAPVDGDPRCPGSPVGRIVHLTIETGTGCTPASVIVVCEQARGPFVDLLRGDTCGSYREIQIDYDARTITDVTPDVSGTGCVVRYSR